jgi:hypothetical protein
MSKSKIAITLEKATLERLNELVAQSIFPNRSQGKAGGSPNGIEGDLSIQGLWLHYDRILHPDAIVG